MALLPLLRDLTAHLRRTRPVRRRVGARLPDGYLESLEVLPAGLVRARGWTTDARPPELTLTCAGDLLEAPRSLRTYRPDVAWVLGHPDPFCGFVIEGVLPAKRYQGAPVRAAHRGQLLGEVPAPPPGELPMAHLTREPEVQGRDQVYGEGAPVHVVSPEVRALVLNTVEGPVLDFGCGAGTLVRELFQAGLAVHGVELDRPAVREGLLPEARDRVTLYSGALPLPFQDGQFAWATAIEVLEHLPDPRPFLAELARVTRKGLVITVPDAGALPLTGPEHTVPWHMLEATHRHFFTAPSLRDAVAAHFPRVRLGAVHEITARRATYFESLVAIGEH